jgi:hypothetical protein
LAATTKAEIAAHQTLDDADVDADTVLEACRFAKRVRRRSGCGQAEYAALAALS